MWSRTRVAAVTGVAALVMVGVAACGRQGRANLGAAGAPGGSAGAVHAVQAAYAATMKAKTATFRLDETIRAKSSSGSSQSATLTGSGQVDFATKSFTESFTAPRGGTIKVMLVNRTGYFQVPAAVRSQIPGHKAWVSIDLNKVSQAKLGESFSQVDPAGSGNPTQALWQLWAVSGGVSKVGSATVAGVPATEYRAQVSLDKVAAKVEATEGARAAQAVRAEIKALGTASLPVDVWIDTHHLIRQIRLQAPIPAASTGGPSGSGKAVATMTFTSFGAPVHLTPPPASQTADITNEVLQQARASSG